MALPMVLWAIALLTGVVLLLAGIIGGWMDEETRAGKAFRARQQALSGIAVAMSGVEPEDPLLNQQSKESDEGYHVVIKDESGLINPNFWLTPDHRDLFKAIFTAWGLPMNDSDAASDGLFDWQSPNPFRSLHGAKKAEYDAEGKAGLPPNAPFLSPDEMELVIGFAPVMKAHPDWRDLFTTSYSGKINLLRAPKEILTGILDLKPAQADAFITLRAGKDGIEGTADDNTNAVTLLPLNPAQKKLKDSFFGTDGKVLRIESTGTCNGVTHLITAIMSPEGTSTNNPQSGATLLGWSEK
jgi:hypothetical protein